ncbi:MAG TPA: branched-chain-amino-acid transaminase [Gammaproteobacteria bacterium]|nr:branched-chain-amino-acid transaminase [Gammaproteobacteria bacterium]
MTVFWVNGSLVPREQAVVPVLDHGLLYGDGVFEGIRFYHRRPFRLGAHRRRLERSAAALRLTLPYCAAELDEAVSALIEAFDGDEGYIRLIVTRGEGPMGLDPAACPRPNVILIATQLEMVPQPVREAGARLIIAATRRLSADGLDPRIKTLNYLNPLLARLEAAHAGADEAVLLNAGGRVAEGTADNLFIVRDGCLLTPPTSEGALAGITRALVLELAGAAGLAAAELPLAPYDLYTADECFLTGTGAELIPVREVDGRPLGACPGPVFVSLLEAFRACVAAETGGA